MANLPADPLLQLPHRTAVLLTRSGVLCQRPLPVHIVPHSTPIIIMRGKNQSGPRPSRSAQRTSHRVLYCPWTQCYQRQQCEVHRVARVADQFTLAWPGAAHPAFYAQPSTLPLNSGTQCYQLTQGITRKSLLTSSHVSTRVLYCPQ